MDNFFLEQTNSTPLIDFNAVTGELVMAGESYPENSFEFYQPIKSWLTVFLAQHQGRVCLHVRLTYLNTSSTKIMMDFLDLLEASHQQGRAVAVIWYCDRENERAIETAEEFKEEITFPFDITLEP